MTKKEVKKINNLLSNFNEDNRPTNKSEAKRKLINQLNKACSFLTNHLQSIQSTNKDPAKVKFNGYSHEVYY